MGMVKRIKVGDTVGYSKKEIDRRMCEIFYKDRKIPRKSKKRLKHLTRTFLESVRWKVIDITRYK